jgi:hypothetical protein
LEAADAKTNSLAGKRRGREWLDEFCKEVTMKRDVCAGNLATTEHIPTP